jgi:hypothetical protein
VNGRPLLIAGRPGAGKTTLVLELMRRGAQLYSDEFVFVRKSDKLVFGLPRTLAIREPTLSIIHDHRLEAECARMKPRWSRRGMFVWDFIDAASIFGESAYAQASPLAALILLDRKTGTQPQLTRISPATAAAAVARLFNTDDMSFSRFADVSALFVDLPCFLLSMHGVEKAADAVSEALG